MNSECEKKVKIEGWLAIEPDGMENQVGFYTGSAPQLTNCDGVVLFCCNSNDPNADWVDFNLSLTPAMLASLLKPGQYIRATLALTLSGSPITPPPPPAA